MAKRKTKPARKPAVRHVFGRLSNIDTATGRWRFELRKCGVVVHRKNRRAKSDFTVDFEALANRGGVATPFGRFTLCAEGVRCECPGSRPKLVLWSTLGNLGSDQSVLFPALMLKQEAVS